MPNVPCNSVGRVLHVRSNSAPSSAAAEVDAFVESASLTVDHCHDVYRGLARLCRGGGGTFRAVIVCVDTLDAPEMEFFALTSQWVGGPPVYVYGHERSTTLVREAIARGATGIASKAAVQGLADVGGEEEDLAPARSVPVVESVPGPQSVTQEVATPVANDPARVDDDAAGTDYELENDESEPVGPARVPWLRYTEGSTRRAPQSPQPPELVDDDATDPDFLLDPTAGDGPLLTQAELHALLGDDIAAIAPDSTRPTDDAGWDRDGDVP